MIIKVMVYIIRFNEFYIELLVCEYKDYSEVGV